MKHACKKFLGIATVLTTACLTVPFGASADTTQLTPAQKWELKTHGEVIIDDLHPGLPGVQKRTKYFSIEHGGWTDLGWAYQFRAAGTINKNVWTGVSPYTCSSWLSDTNPWDSFSLGVKQIRIDDSPWDAESAWCGR
ncbi:hypothetical protein [Bacillus sp. FDAARGOS_1420]|uniref:hypothetical protein n=1 Tax=unclassified Bacillus (in: firmicutes) TaxID=185979 RepID=UPI001C5B4E20|nr:hypothetical protein [Bacillus sp. FDAARGOS_1420]MBW3496251.1 hypothetical protein [Bacillus sp. FDAARGOS_1420]